MGKTIKGKDKAARKIAAAKRKIARKTKRGAVAAVVAAFALALLLSGCATSEAMQPAKSMTQNNEFKNCTFIMASKAVVSNDVVVAEGDSAPALEMFTQTQSLESTGTTDTFGQTATQTPTTDVKPDIDVNYNDALKNATDASKGVLESLADSSAKAVLQMMASKGSGTVAAKLKDGSTANVKCDNGQCSICTDCSD